MPDRQPFDGDRERHEPAAVTGSLEALRKAVVASAGAVWTVLGKFRRRYRHQLSWVLVFAALGGLVCWNLTQLQGATVRWSLAIAEFVAIGCIAGGGLGALVAAGVKSPLSSAWSGAFVGAAVGWVLGWLWLSRLASGLPDKLAAIFVVPLYAPHVVFVSATAGALLAVLRRKR